MIRFSSSVGQRTPLAPFGAATNPQYTQAVAPLLGQLAQTAGNMATGSANALSGLGQAGAHASANAYQGYASGMGSMATALANERGNMYGANAMAEAARMGALGNIGSAGLGAYGSMGNNAMQAWAQNQASYNQALAGMQNANQAALGGMGQARYGALGSLAGPSVARSLFGGSAGSPGFSFNATAGGDPVASGQIGGRPGWFFGGSSSGGDALNSLRNDIMSPDMANAAMYANTDAMNRLEGQHLSSRYMPSQMLNQGLGGLMALSNNSIGHLNSGMNQYYTNNALAGNQFYDQVPGMIGMLGMGMGRGIQGSLASAQQGIGGAMNQGQGFLNSLFGSIQPTR